MLHITSTLHASLDSDVEFLLYCEPKGSDFERRLLIHNPRIEMSEELSDPFVHLD